MQNDNLSYRRRVIGLVKGAVMSYNRAVKLGDLQTYIESIGGAGSLDGRKLTVTLARLVHGGELYIAKQGRKDKHGGNFYLPTGIDAVGYIENLPPSWLDIVWQAFQELWAKRKTEFESELRLPEPLSTEEVEAFIIERFGKAVFPPEKTATAYALAYLCKPKPEPVIKKLRRSSFGQCLWIPKCVSANHYNQFGTAKNKSETVNLMVQSAVQKYGRPVTANEITQAAKEYSKFQKHRRISLEYLINGTNFSLIKRIGLISGEWYYYYGNISQDNCDAFVTIRHLAEQWSRIGAFRELESLKFCKLPAAIFGRLLLIRQNATQITNQLTKIINTANISNQICNDAMVLATEIESILNNVNERVTDTNTRGYFLPSEVVQDVKLLNYSELSAFLKPMFYKARKAEHASKIADLIGRDIKAILNSEYKPIFTGNSPVNEIPRFLFDRFDVLIYTAVQLGGNVCRTIAMMAKSEMGILRDPRFVLPMLKSANYEQRLGAVACLAFLQIPEHQGELYAAAVHDKDSGVRQIALWAYAFLKGYRLKELLSEIKKRETQLQVLKLLEQIEGKNPDNMWFI